MFSGAMHNLYLVYDGQLTELKGNRIPIGGIASGVKTRFTTQMHLLYPDLKIYMSTDGYFDQFNGSTIKKFSKSRFRQLLLDINEKPLAEQKSILWSQHNDWKNTATQTDDICVFGCSVKELLVNNQRN